MKFQPTTVRASDEVGVGGRTSDSGPQTSDLGFRLRVISDFRFEILDFRPRTSDLKAWSS